MPVLKQNSETSLLLETQVKPALDKLKEYPDADVKYFAEKALLTGKKNKKIMSTVLL